LIGDSLRQPLFEQLPTGADDQAGCTGQHRQRRFADGDRQGIATGCRQPGLNIIPTGCTIPGIKLAGLATLGTDTGNLVHCLSSIHHSHAPVTLSPQDALVRTGRSERFTSVDTAHHSEFVGKQCIIEKVEKSMLVGKEFRTITSALRPAHLPQDLTNLYA
jgi:hypothetical protein